MKTRSRQTIVQRISGSLLIMLSISVITIPSLGLSPKKLYASEPERKASNARELEEWVASAYCSCQKCCGKADGITASGKVAQAGRTVAVNWLPFGTVVRIDGKEYRVEDRGAVSHFGSRKKPKKRVDIYMASHAEALAWGKRTVNVEVENAG